MLRPGLPWGGRGRRFARCSLPGFRTVARLRPGRRGSGPCRRVPCRTGYRPGRQSGSHQPSPVSTALYPSAASSPVTLDFPVPVTPVSRTRYMAVSLRSRRHRLLRVPGGTALPAGHRSRLQPGHPDPRGDQARTRTARRRHRRLRASTTPRRLRGVTTSERSSDADRRIFVDYAERLTVNEHRAYRLDMYSRKYGVPRQRYLDSSSMRSEGHVRRRHEQEDRVECSRPSSCSAGCRSHA
jgi:hypothetical protein